MGLGRLPQLLIQTLDGLVSARPRILKVDTASMTLVDNHDGSSTIGATGGGGSLEVKEVDGAPDVTSVTKIVVSNGTLTDDGSGQVTLTTGGGGGGTPTELQATVVNRDGVTLTKGTVVRAEIGSDGVTIGVESTNNVTGSPTFGVMAATVTAGSTGLCQIQGLLAGLDTSAFAVGDDLYCGASGALTNTQPTFPTQYQKYVGVVVTVNATTGSIYVRQSPAIISHVHMGAGDGTAFGAASSLFPAWKEATPNGSFPPAAGYQTIYIDPTTHHVCRKDSSAVVVDLETLAGTGTVTSVAMTVPSDMGVSGSPVTTTGTLAVTRNTQTANKVLASATSGGSATPDFRALVAADIPAIAESGVTSLVTDLGNKAPVASPTFTGITTAPEFSASGLTGAVAASRYVGATASGAPVSGTFVLGDWIAAQDGKRWTCTVGGTPGTWVQEPGTGGGSGNVTSTGAGGSEPGSPASGDLYLPNTGGPYIERYSGSAWIPWGPIYPMTIPPAAGWTWAFQGSANITTEAGGSQYLYIASSNSDTARMRYRAVVGTYTITAAIQPLLPGVATSSYLGIGFYNTSTALSALIRVAGDGSISVSKHGNTGGGVAHYVAPVDSGSFIRSTGVWWLQISDDGVNRISRWSTDGRHWHQVHSVTRTDYLTADSVCMFIGGGDPSEIGLSLISWEQT